jgi:transposase
MKIKDARSLSASAQEALRRRAVNAIQQGKRQNEVCQFFGVSHSALNKWLKLYRELGSKGLKPRKRGRPRTLRLKPWQCGVIVRLITDKLPDQLKLPFALWTREAVQQLIKQRFDLDVSIWTVGRYLKRWGFTPQKPVRRALEQSPKAVKKWLEDEYPAIRKQAQKEKAEIHWEDETGLRSDHQTGRTYGRKGKTPVIPSTGQRFGCNVISTITNRGTLRFMVFQGKFNSQVFITLLSRLVKSAKGKKIFLIVDNHRVHRSKKVKSWTEAHKKQIIIFYLPSYSPELNPDEFLNNDLKSNSVGPKRAKDPEELEKNARQFLRRKQKRPHEVINYFHARSVKYALN